MWEIQFDILMLSVYSVLSQYLKKATIYKNNLFS